MRPGKGRKEGSILKNSKFQNSDGTSEVADVSLDYSPANVSRNHGIDQYYRVNVGGEAK